MKSRLFKQTACGVAAVIAAMSAAVQAKPLHSTSYTYYGISGNSPASIYSSLLKRGPRVGGVKAYASTTAVSSQAGQMQQGKLCEIKNYKFKIDFTIKLPKLQNEAALTGGTRSEWRNFSAFLKTHEETHRSIWLTCAAALEADVKAVRTSNCKQADAKATALWNKMKASCSKKQVAFDAQQQRALLRQPFVQLVLKRGGRSQHALAVPSTAAE
jgi:predicted secreted Zn-dependent protease